MVKHKYNLFLNCLDCFKMIHIMIQSWSFLTIEATDVQFFKNSLSYSFSAWAENSKNIKMVILGRKLTKLEKLQINLIAICNVHISLFKYPSPQIARNLLNTSFSQSQNARYARTLCTLHNSISSGYPNITKYVPTWILRHFWWLLICWSK